MAARQPSERCVRIPNRTENTETATESSREYRNGHRIGSRIPNRPSISVFNSHLIQIAPLRMVSQENGIGYNTLGD